MSFGNWSTFPQKTLDNSEIIMYNILSESEGNAGKHPYQPPIVRQNLKGERTMSVNKIWQLLYDNAAGEYQVYHWTEDEWENWEQSGVRNQYGHYNVVATGSSEVKLAAAIAWLAGPDIWCVFFNRASWEGFVTTENGISGNWRGSKHGYYNLVAEYSEAKYPDAKEQANKHLRDMLAA